MGLGSVFSIEKKFDSPVVNSDSFYLSCQLYKECKGRASLWVLCFLCAAQAGLANTFLPCHHKGNVDFCVFPFPPLPDPQGICLLSIMGWEDFSTKGRLILIMHL